MKKIYNEVGTLVVAPKFKINDWVCYATVLGGCIRIDEGRVCRIDVFVSVESSLQREQGYDTVNYYINGDVVSEKCSEYFYN